MLRTLFAFLLLLSLQFTASAADTLRVLFIGNSYTDVNNLPQVFTDLAASGGSVVIKSASVPGGTTFQQHSTLPATLSLIAQGGWDAVVLQEQSQLPSFSDAQVASSVLPYARKLDSLVHAASPCAKTCFYMTWGRKNGDAGNCAFLPWVCTYQGMDSALQQRYLLMADSFNAWVSPVAKVWRRLRVTSPAIDLYDADESHPSMAGTYAAACSFYAVLFGKNPANLSYNAGLAPATAQTIRAAAKTVAFDSLSTWRGFAVKPLSVFSHSVSGATVSFTNTSANATNYYWTFGNGSSSSLAQPNCTYTSNGSYTVTLRAIRCKDTSIVTKTVTISKLSVPDIASEGWSIGPNPVQDLFHITAPAPLQSVRIYDAAGRLVLEEKPLTIEWNGSLAHLHAGVYYLHASAGSIVRQSSFIKQ